METKVEILDNLIKSFRVRWSFVLKKNYPDLYQEVVDYNTSKFDDTFSLRQCVYNYTNQIKEIPKCVVCGKPSRFVWNEKTKDYGYSRVCCFECSKKDKKKYENIKNTCMKKYGAENPFGSKDVQDKIKKTLLEKYGSESVGGIKEFEDRIKRANIEKFGVEYASQNLDVKKKIRNTLMRKYGVDSPMKIDGAIDKVKHTCMERYGVSWNSKSKSVVDKRKATFLVKYGVENPFQLDSVREKARAAVSSKVVQDKIKKTIMDRYGVESIAKIPGVREKRNDTMTRLYGRDTSIDALLNYRKEQNLIIYNNLKENRDIKFELLTKFEDFHGLENPALWRCKRCGTEVFRSFSSVGAMHCKCCGQSSGQYELYEFIKKICPDAVIDDRSVLGNGMEVDVFVPSKKIGFEYNGLYWHSDVFVPNDYHENKANLAETAGIRLITIFEDEWMTKRNLLKIKIERLLGIKAKSIYARKCVPCMVDKNVAKRFLDKYHIQGADNSKYYIGLKYNGHLVAVGGFFTDHKNENGYILSRYATIFNRTIVGGLGKIMGAFSKVCRVNTIRTFSDRRYSIGGMYEKIGFKKLSYVRPAYWYTKGNIERVHRFNMRKEDFKKTGMKYVEGMTERELATLNGYHRVYDCGYYEYILHNIP